MCNIVTFRFTCQHTLRRRRSRCGGTRHKVTANSTKAACIAQSFLTICLQIECDRCQHTAWEDAWKLRLKRASKFLAKIQQRDMPGVEEVAALVRELEAEYATASWKTRTMFAHETRPSITRVKHSYYEKAASKLPQEVRPEDIIEKTGKEWTEMGDHDYDGNYEASTDPVHPVSTDYSHPLDDDDGAWILEHLSEAGVVDTHGGEPFDLDNGHGWSWGEDDNDTEAQTTADAWQEEAITPIQEPESSQPSKKTDNTPMTWGPEINAPASIPTTQLNGSTRLEEEHKTNVNQVLTTFWSVVNHNASSITPRPSTSLPAAEESSLEPSVQALHISNTHDALSPPREPSTPPPPSRQPSTWTDDPSRSPHTPSPSHPPEPPLRSPTPPSPNSTRSWYDKQREMLELRRDADVSKYYRDWLHVSRCEMRDCNGPEGNVIHDPVEATSGRLAGGQVMRSRSRPRQFST